MVSPSSVWWKGQEDDGSWRWGVNGVGGQGVGLIIHVDNEIPWDGCRSWGRNEHYEPGAKVLMVGGILPATLHCPLRPRALSSQRSTFALFSGVFL